MYVRLPDIQVVQKQLLADQEELARIQAPRSLPELLDLYQHSPGERLSSGGLGRPTVRAVLDRPHGRRFRNPSHSEVLVINELSVAVHGLPPASRNGPGGPL